MTYVRTKVSLLTERPLAMARITCLSVRRLMPSDEIRAMSGTHLWGMTLSARVPCCSMTLSTPTSIVIYEVDESRPRVGHHHELSRVRQPDASMTRIAVALLIVTATA